MADEYQKRIDLGIFTAYGEAVNAGYEGTKEEFEAGLVASASYAENAQASAEAAAASETAAETAQGKAEDAQEAAETAQGKAEDAQTAAEAAQAAAETAALTLTIDPTLTQSGQAADAKVTGDALDVLDGILSSKSPVAIQIRTAKEKAYIGYDDGLEGSSNNYDLSGKIRVTMYKSLTFSRAAVTPYTSNVAALAFFEADGTYISGIKAKTGAASRGYEDYTVSSIPADAAYAVMSLIRGVETTDPYIVGVPKYKDLADTVAALDTASTEQAAAIAANTEAIAGNAGNISDLQEENSAQTGRIVTLEENAETQASAVSALQDIAVAQAESLASLGETSSSHTTQIAALDSGKVDKVQGKGLSQNDYTDADKAALDNIKTTDPTLTISGKAADAMATGTSLNKLTKADTSALNKGLLTSIDFAQGRYNATSGAAMSQSSTLYIRTLNYLPEDIVAVSPANGYTIGVHVWDTGADSDTYLGMVTSSGIKKNSGDAGIHADLLDLRYYPKTYRFKVVLYAPDEGAVYWYMDFVKVAVYRETDKSLLTENQPADAKSVGKILEIANLESTDTGWVQGGINTSNGSDSNRTDRIRLDQVSPDVDTIKVVDGSNIAFRVFAWDNTNATTPYKGYWTGSGFSTSGTPTKFVQLDPSSVYAEGATLIKLVAIYASDDTLNIATSAGENVLFITNTNVVKRLENDANFNMDWTRLFSSDFEKGRLNATSGVEQSDGSTTLMRTRDYLPNNVAGVQAASGYKIGIFVYDPTIVIPDPNPDNIRQFLGTITTTGIRINAGDAQWRTDFVDLRKYPASYKFRVVLTENTGATLNIAVDYAGLKVYTQKNGIAVRSLYDHGPYDIYTGRFSDWYSCLQTEFSEGFNVDTTYAQVISAFDGLMALDSSYITKTSLGTVSGTVVPRFDGDGEPYPYNGETYEYEMWDYTFKPKRYDVPIDFRKTKIPKIYMDGSMHGFEKGSTFGLYYFLRDLTTNWTVSPLLAALRQSVEIHVIPVSNPWGFDHNTYQNGQGVNINRNFDHYGTWTVVPAWDSDATGEEAFDQQESQIMRDWLIAAEPDLLLYACLHTYNRNHTSSYEDMTVCYNYASVTDVYANRFFRVLGNHINEQTLRWPSMYPAISPGPTRMLGRIQAHYGSNPETVSMFTGYAAGWAYLMRHIVALTLEGINGLKDNNAVIIPLFSNDAYKINAENIGNLIVQTLREYGD